MILFFAIAAAVAAAAMVGSALSSLSRTTPTDAVGRGPWGVLDWVVGRRRRLDPHQRRWQTALISAERRDNRWPELLGQLTRLETAAEAKSDPLPPKTFDLDWLRGRVAALGAATDASDSLPTPTGPAPTGDDR